MDESRHVTLTVDFVHFLSGPIESKNDHVRMDHRSFFLHSAVFGNKIVKND